MILLNSLLSKISSVSLLRHFLSSVSPLLNFGDPSLLAVFCTQEHNITMKNILGGYVSMSLCGLHQRTISIRGTIVSASISTGNTTGGN